MRPSLPFMRRARPHLAQTFVLSLFTDSQNLALLDSSSVSSPVGTITLPLWTDPSPAIFTSPASYVCAQLHRPHPNLSLTVTGPSSDPQQPTVPDYLEAAHRAPTPGGAILGRRPLWDDSLTVEDIEQDSVRNCSLISGMQATYARNQVRAAPGLGRHGATSKA